MRTKGLALSAVANFLAAIAAVITGEFLFGGIFLCNAIGLGLIPVND